jgi:hypothetical protein
MTKNKKKRSIAIKKGGHGRISELGKESILESEKEEEEKDIKEEEKE